MLVPRADLFCLAGEPSGDAYAAAIVDSMRFARSDLVVAAAGCERLRQAEVEIDVDMAGKAVMGFVPVLARLGEFRALLARVVAAIRARRPRVVLTVDYPGFNLRVVAALQDLRRSGTRFIHVVAPQVWAWRRRRAKRIARLVDRLCCFFPFEPVFFTRHGGDARFVGHPLVDLAVAGEEECRGVVAELALGQHDRLLLLAPGSREREIAALLPIFDEVAQRLLPELPVPSGGRVVAAVAQSGEVATSAYRRHSGLPLVADRYRALCALAHFGLVASGTATLEAALLGLPHLIAYRSDHLSMTLARNLVQVPHIGLPNIVHGRRLCPELLHRECTPDRLEAHVRRLWQGPLRAAQVALLGPAMRDALGGGGALSRIAGMVEAMLAE